MLLCESRHDGQTRTTACDTSVAVADLHRKILHAHPRSNFLHFHAVFGKFWPNNSFGTPVRLMPPPLLGWCPPGIMDPPIACLQTADDAPSVFDIMFSMFGQKSKYFRNPLGIKITPTSIHNCLNFNIFQTPPRHRFLKKIHSKLL